MYNVILYLLYKLHDQLGFRGSTYQGLELSISQLTQFPSGCSHSLYICIALAITPTQACAYLLHLVTLRPACIHCIHMIWTCSYLSYPHPRPTQACSYLLYLVLLGPGYTHCTHAHAYPGLPISIVLSVPQVCLYLLYPHSGWLKPAHIHCTWCYSSLVIPIILMPIPIQAYPYSSYLESLRPGHIHHTHIQTYSGLLTSIILGVTWAWLYSLYPYPG